MRAVEIREKLAEIASFKKLLSDSDYKITRYVGRKAAGLVTKLTEEDFLSLESSRNTYRESINEITETLLAEGVTV